MHNSPRTNRYSNSISTSLTWYGVVGTGSPSAALHKLGVAGLPKARCFTGRSLSPCSHPHLTAVAALLQTGASSWPWHVCAISIKFWTVLELRSWVKAEVDVLGSPFLIVPTDSACGRKATLKKKISLVGTLWQWELPSMRTRSSDQKPNLLDLLLHYSFVWT